MSAFSGLATGGFQGLADDERLNKKRELLPGNSGRLGDEKQDLCRENMGIQDDSRFGVGTWVNFEWLGLTVNHQQWQGKPSVCRRKNGFNQCKINESMMLGPLKIL